jgi:hypothetical protein
VFFSDPNVKIYYSGGAVGWPANFANVQTASWNGQLQSTGPNFGIQNSQFGFTITGTNGLPVTVESCTDLTSGVWTPIKTLSLSGNSEYFSDPNSTNAPNTFYRIVP